MSGLLVSCQHCDGQGKIRCNCRASLDLDMLWHTSTARGYCHIVRCRRCKQLWKLQWQRGDLESTWLKPGMCKEGYSFDYKETVTHLVPSDLLHLPYIELLKHVPFDTLVEYRKQLECDHPDLLGFGTIEFS